MTIPDKKVKGFLNALKRQALKGDGLCLPCALRAARINTTPNSSLVKSLVKKVAGATHLVAKLKGFVKIKVLANGGVSFKGSPYLYPTKKGERNIVKIKLTGSRRNDFKLANEKAKLNLPKGQEAPDNYTWHHVNDYDPKTGEATMELVRTDAHEATFPHKGSVSQYEKHKKVKYKR